MSRVLTQDQEKTPPPRKEVPTDDYPNKNQKNNNKNVEKDNAGFDMGRDNRGKEQRFAEIIFSAYIRCRDPATNEITRMSKKLKYWWCKK